MHLTVYTLDAGEGGGVGWEGGESVGEKLGAELEGENKRGGGGE